MEQSAANRPRRSHAQYGTPPFSPHRAGRGAGAQYADLQACLAGAGDHRADPADESGNRSSEPNLCAGAEEAGLKKILWGAIMEGKKSAL